MIFPTIIEKDSNLYKILRIIPKHNFIKKGETQVNLKVLEFYKNYFNSDKVVQNDTHFIFLKYIPEIEFEEIIENHLPLKPPQKLSN